MKKLVYILVEQGITSHGDIREQINAGFTATNENFTAVETMVSENNASVSALMNKVDGEVMTAINALRAKSVPATPEQDGYMTAAQVKTLNSAIQQGTLTTALENKVDKVSGMGLSRHDYSDVDHDVVQQTKVILDDVKSEMIVTFSDIVSGVTVAPGSTDVIGKLVYDEKTNKILWKVIYPGNPTPTYFAQVYQKPIVGTNPLPGVVYKCGNRVFVGIEGGLSEQFRSVIETIE